MTWETLTVGRVQLTEPPLRAIDEKVNASTGAQDIVVTGQEAWPPRSRDDVLAAREDLMALYGQQVPVVFGEKTHLNGWYEVSDAGVSLSDWGQAGRADWNLSLRRIGAPAAVDVESRLVGVARATNYVITGERWHAPAAGAVGYYFGTSSLASRVVRSGAEGDVTVFRSVPASGNPVWHVGPESFYDGAARVVVDGITRSAVHTDIDPGDWALENTLVRIEPGGTSTFLVSCFDGTTWDATRWNLTVGGSGTSGQITEFDAVSVVRNDPEVCVLRLVEATAPTRITVDVTVRRGSRVVECLLRSGSSHVNFLWLDTTQTLTDSTVASGYVVASADDAAGNRVLAGSMDAVTFVAGRGFYNSSTSIVFYVGAVVGGGAAQPGDTAADLVAQYSVTPAESTALIRR